MADKILKRISGKGRGYSFTSKDFLDLGSRGTVDMALSALTKQAKIRRISRGLYDYPKHSKLLGGMASPAFGQVAHAIARKSGIRIQRSGALAANLLGLSEQVPAKIVYLTDGRSRTIRIGSQTITFKRTSPKELLPDKKTALVVHALRFLGKDAVTDQSHSQTQEDPLSRRAQTTSQGRKVRFHVGPRRGEANRTRAVRWIRLHGHLSKSTESRLERKSQGEITLLRMPRLGRHGVVHHRLSYSQVEGFKTDLTARYC